MADTKKTQRKFILALLFTIGGIIGLAFGKLDGQAYFLLAGAVLATYGAANVWEKK